MSWSSPSAGEGASVYRCSAPKAVQEESRMGLAVWPNMVVKARALLVPLGGDTSLRRVKPFSKLAGKLN